LDRKGVREEVARIQIGAVSSDRIDLFRKVRPPNETFPSAAHASGSNDDDVAKPDGPLALDAKQVGTDIEDQVVTLVP
jgi:hypothetical protein